VEGEEMTGELWRRYQWQMHGNCTVVVIDYYPTHGSQLFAVFMHWEQSLASKTCYLVAGHCYDSEWPHAWICHESTCKQELWTIGKSDWHKGAVVFIVAAASEKEALFDSRVLAIQVEVTGVYSFSGKCVYAIEDGSGRCKIGKATDIKKRVSQLQTGNANKLRVAAVLDCEQLDESSVEKEVHRILGKKRVYGEWFLVGAREAEQALYEAGSAFAEAPRVIFYGE
jgi:hypothetical protein